MEKDAISNIILIIAIIAAVIVIAIGLGHSSTGFATGDSLYSSAQTAATQAGLTSPDNVAFNLQFDGFNNTRASAGEVKSMIDTVRSSNAEAKDNSQIVTVFFAGASHSSDEELELLLESITTAKKYTMATAKDAITGLVSKITVTENSN